MTASWLADVTRKVQALATLKENWDSYGASPVDPNSIAEALNVVASLAEVEGIDAPAVGAGPDGHVGFSWDGGAWSLDAEIMPDERIEIVYLDASHPGDERADDDCDLADLCSLLTLRAFRRMEDNDGN